MILPQELKLHEREFTQFRKMIFELAGISLADTKQVMVQGRLAKRLRALKLNSYKEYLDYLLNGGDASETTKFVNALTTNKTEFFREKHHFDYLTSTIFPALSNAAEAGAPKRLRIWCSASSTGEEPYTIAMTVHEYFGQRQGWDIRILASDIDTDVLATASEGIYDSDSMDDVPLHLRSRYFTRLSKGKDSRWRVSDSLREMVTFRQINLLHTQWPINTLFDVIFCRNVMIYFNTQTQTQVVEHFADKIKENGHLIIGHSESLLGLTDKYKSLGETVYRCIAPKVEKQGALQANLAPAPSNASSMNLPKSRLELRSKPLRKAPGTQAAERNLSLARRSQAVDSERRSIIVGELHASKEPMWISTLLGSCIAVCLFDDVAKVGGMNHFMLPDSKHNQSVCASFGVHAMELLINQVMSLGGDRRRLKAKLFGGCSFDRPADANLRIGKKNADFATEFLDREDIPVVARHTGGKNGMRVDFHTHTTKVLLKPLDPVTTCKLDEDGQRQSRSVVESSVEHSNVDLF